MLNKSSLIEAIIRKLEAERAAIEQAALAAHAAATHEESKAEDQYDTRGLEASYLAGAQAERAAQLERFIAMFKFETFAEARPGGPVQMGSLVEVESEGRKSLYLLVPQGGGLSVQCDGRTVQVITPQAPLGESLLDRRVGETVEVEIGEDEREYRILEVV